MPTRSTSSAAAENTDTKAQRTRTRILDAAAHVLSVKGFAGTRLADVAEHAELQAPTIYYYFPSREDLIEEVMSCGISEMQKHLREVLDALPPETPAMDRIVAAVEAHLRHELELSSYTTASIRNAGQLPEHLQKRHRRVEKSYGRLWHTLFADALARGELRSGIDLRTARLLVMGALNWAAEWRDPRRDSVDTIVSTAQMLVRTGLSADSTPAPRTRRTRSTR